MIFQNIEPDNICVTPFQAHKQYTVDNTNYTTKGIEIFSASYSPIVYNISDGTNQPVIQNGKYEYLIHNSIYTSYYNNNDRRPLNTYSDLDNAQYRYIGEHINLISIPQNIYGEQITPNSLILTSPSISPTLTIIDDGHGNLLDSGSYSTNKAIIDTFNTNQLLSYDFIELYRDNKIYDKSKFRFDGSSYNVTQEISTGTISGNYMNMPKFNGVNSYIQIPHHDELVFNKTNDFNISFYVDPISSGTIISKDGMYIDYSKDYASGSMIKSGSFPYPYKIEYNSTNAQISASVYDGSTKINLAGSITGGSTVSFQRSNGTLELYINGSSTSHVVDTTNAEMYNNCFIHIGQSGNNNDFFGGVVHKLKISSDAKNRDLISYYSALLLSQKDDYHVGNIFYESGMVVLTSNTQEMDNILNDWNLGFKATKTIYEYDILCQINAAELNSTFNTSLKRNSTYTDDYYADKTNHPEFTPYITTVGLYNDNLDLIAVAKVSRPIKKLKGVDITFNIKFDI